MHRPPEKQSAWLESDVAQLLRELKAPLARIAADATALLRTGADNPSTHALHRIDHSIMILERSIEQLMEINAVESGDVALDRRNIDLGNLIDLVIASSPERGRISHHIDQHATVIADQRHLGFGIASLLYAALSCPPRTSQISVHSGAEGLLAKISVMASAGGTEHALGLHIARRIARTHGGTASMRERAGMTSFVMELPLSRAQRNRRYGDNTVLLVDDNLEQVSALAELLRDDGLAIAYATSGREALDLIESAMPDMLIVDMQIPDMDGTEVIRRALDLSPGLPAVLLTGYPREHPRVIHALETTGSRYLPKPVDISDLLDVVADVLRI